MAQKRMSYYQQMIARHLTKLGAADVDPRWIEAHMRMEHSTLDGLGAWRFQSEVESALHLVKITTKDFNERLAASFGL